MTTSPLPIRGMVEGFYGPPYTHELGERLRILAPLVEYALEHVA
jgi:hypothetical protein